MSTLAQTARQPQSVSPSITADFLFCLLVSRQHHEAVLGDLWEHYYRVLLPRFGPTWAKVLYWSEMLKAIFEINLALVRTHGKWIVGVLVAVLGTVATFLTRLDKWW